MDIIPNEYTVDIEKQSLAARRTDAIAIHEYNKHTD